jgi:glyoxylase I family protein
MEGFHGVRYQVTDVARAIAFYTQHLGLKLEHRALPAFALVSIGGAHILLSSPGASGSRPMPNGEPQQPRNWNRIVLASAVGALKEARLRVRNDVETGPGGRQIQIDDPDGNPIELFEPTR